MQQYYTPDQVVRDGFLLEIDTDHARAGEQEVFLLEKFNKPSVVSYDFYSARSFSNTNGGWRIQRYAMPVLRS